jgi:hypothetical protein
MWYCGGMFKVAAALQCDAGQKRRSSGMSNNGIAKAVKTTRPTVLMWRARFEQFGCPGLLKD